MMLMCKIFLILIIIESINCFSISNYFALKRKKGEQQPVKSNDLNRPEDEVFFKTHQERFPGKIIVSDVEISADAGIILFEYQNI
jgi:hypothetical protein